MTVNPATATTRPTREFRRQFEDLARRIASVERATTTPGVPEGEEPLPGTLPALEARLEALEARISALEATP